MNRSLRQILADGSLYSGSRSRREDGHGKYKLSKAQLSGPYSESDHPEVPAKPSPLHIPSLDGLRAASILIVFASHAGYANSIPGRMGVAVFFFLSGYLITTLLRIERQKTGTVSLRNFYIRRFWRIIPPLYITIGLIVLAHLVGVFTTPLRPAAVLTGALFVNNYNGVLHVAPMTDLVTLWSLAVEEHFYLIFPAFYLLFLGRQKGSIQALTLGGLCLAVLVWRIILVYSLGETSSLSGAWYRTDTCIDSILFGCIMALWCNPVIEEDRERRWPSWSWIAGVALLVLCLVVRSDAFRDTWRFTLEGIAFMPIFYCAITQADRWPFKLLNTRAFVIVGLGSYTLYLIHLAVLVGMERVVSWPSLRYMPIAMAVCGLYAYAMYKLVEKPCARLRRRFSST